jgi:hypothetical protein
LSLRGFLPLSIKIKSSINVVNVTTYCKDIH